MSLILNFSPIQFEDSEISVGRLPYGDDGEQVLEQLRAEHYATHVFRREGPNSMFAVPVAAEAHFIGEPETIRLKEHLTLTTSLIRNALLTYFAGLGMTVLSYEPMKLISRKDLLRISCPQGIELPDWLGVRLLYDVAIRPIYDVAIRPIYFFGHKPLVAAVIDVRTTRLIEQTAADLLADGVCLKGVYVGKRVPRKDPRIAPEFELLGCVQSVEGSQLRLTDSRHGIEAVEASKVWPWKEVFATCVSHVLKERAPEMTAALERQRAALRQGPARLDHITRMLDSLGNRPHEMAPGTPFTFGPLLDNSVPHFPKLESAPRPTFVFDGTGSKTHKWHDEGLNKYGPYTAHVQTLAPPRICVICQRSQKGPVDQFLRKFFFDGVMLPQSSSRYQGKPPKNYFDRGFCRKYGLDRVHYEFFLADGNSADSYHKACQEALEKHGNGQPWDLALVQIEEGFHQLPPECNPYFVAKLSFQTVQIVVQEFEIETTRKWGSPLSFCLNNMGLATYAKLNGTPWLMEGIGSSFFGASQSQLKKRVKMMRGEE